MNCNKTGINKSIHCFCTEQVVVFNLSCVLVLLQFFLFGFSRNNETRFAHNKITETANGGKQSNNNNEIILLLNYRNEALDLIKRLIKAFN